MKPSRLLLCFSVATLLSAQEIKLGGLITLWGTQMLDSELRRNPLAGSIPGQSNALTYYPLHGGFRENGFVVRRSELYLSSQMSPQVSWNLACDPNFSGSILSDAAITWSPTPEWSLRIGQFKPLQGYEGTLVTAPNLIFYDRSILARQFGDKWDRGATLTYAQRQKDTVIRWSFGVFNGGGRAADLNAQKDVVARIDVEGPSSRFGVYGLYGKSDASSTQAVAYPLPGTGAPDDQSLRSAFDLTTNYGLYAVLDRGPWHAELEAMGGRLGRRYPTLGPAPSQPSPRQHLDQRFLGTSLTLLYRLGRHAFTARFDRMNYNAGGRWYGSNPYVLPSGDYTPFFTETVLGWNRALADEKRWRTVHFKLNYIHRTGPMLLPTSEGQSPLAADSLVAVLQVGF